MKCPACGARMGVTHTRDLGDVVIRRRLCPECGKVQKTVERWDTETLIAARQLQRLIQLIEGGKK